MNLMFRKNFREGMKSSGGGTKLTSKANRSQGKRSRDMGYGNVDADVQYRTHIFFPSARNASSNDCEGLCAVCALLFKEIQNQNQNPSIKLLIHNCGFPFIKIDI